MLGGQKALEHSPPAGECRTDCVCVCLDWCEQMVGVGGVSVRLHPNLGKDVKARTP